MKETGKRRLYPEQFKKEAVSLITEHGYSVVQAAQVVDTSAKNFTALGQAAIAGKKWRAFER